MQLGQSFSADGPGRAALHAFADGVVVIPPSGWTPLTASDAELQAYAYPPRPSGGAELDAWTAMYSHYQRPTTAGLCVDKSRSATTSYKDLANWVGPIAANSTPMTPIRRVYGSTRVPTFVSATCSPTSDISNSSMASWVGIGAGADIMQGGWVTYSTQLNGVKGFYEVLGKNYDTGLVSPLEADGITPLTVSAGGLLYSDVYYLQSATDPSNHLTTSMVQFAFHDWGTNTDATGYLDKYKGLGGHLASDFYDGSHGEALDERVRAGTYTKLRPYTGSVEWNDVYVANQSLPAVAIGSDNIEIDRMFDGGPLATVVGNALNPDLKSWSVAWNNCGVRD